MSANLPDEHGIVIAPRLLWAIGSVAAIIAGSLGPWITVGPLSLSGTSAGKDGTVTVVLGVVAAVLVISKRSRPAVGLVAAAALAVGVIDSVQVLRLSQDTFIGRIAIGWGLVVLTLGAASLFAWAITEIARYSSHGKTRLWAVTGTVVALAITIGALAASGRFDSSDEAGTTSDSAPSGQSAGNGATANKPKETCTGLGITAAEGGEGACVAENGWRVQVANADSQLRLDDLLARVVGIQVVDELPDVGGEAVKPSGRFVRVTIKIHNSTNAPIDIAPEMFALRAADKVNDPDLEAALETTIVGETIGPDLSTTGDVTFDVSPKVADGVTRDGNLIVFQPSDDGAPDEPSKPVGVIRTYGATAPVTAHDATPSGSPDEGRYTPQEAFQSPSKKIDCVVLRDDLNRNRVECTRNENASTDGETTWFRLDNTGRAVTFRRTVFQGEASESRYGETLYLYGGTAKVQGDDSVLRCTTETSGVTCRNSRHGFRLAKGVHETF